MTVTVASFKLVHKEFDSIDSDVVQLHLDEAVAETDSEVCGSLTDKVVRLRAADALARNPFGQQATLVDDEGKTPYSKTLEDLLDRLGRTAGIDEEA